MKPSRALPTQVSRPKARLWASSSLLKPATPTAMNSLLRRYCEKNGCSEASFYRKVFWECLHRRALVVAPFFGGWKSNYFAADRALIAEIARAERMSQVAEDIGAFALEPDNTRWLRKTARIRVSGRRVQRLAKRYLLATAPSAATGSMVSNASAPHCDTLGG